MNKDKLLHIKEKSLEELKNRLDYEKVYEDKDRNFKLKGKFYENQTRLVLKNCGIIDPNNIDKTKSVFNPFFLRYSKVSI